MVKIKYFYFSSSILDICLKAWYIDSGEISLILLKRLKLLKWWSNLFWSKSLLPCFRSFWFTFHLPPSRFCPGEILWCASNLVGILSFIICLLSFLISEIKGVRKIARPFRVRVWFRISVRIRAGRQFPSGAIFLEPKLRQHSRIMSNVWSGNL